MPDLLHTDVALRALNTFGVDARAAWFARVHSVDELRSVLADSRVSGLPRLVLGGGSNVLFTRDFDGLVLQVALAGLHEIEGDGNVRRLRVGAGEGWHATVEQALARGLAGLENLALIPGSVGAAPIQNIGAYGVELAERFDHLTVLDPGSGAVRTFDLAECQFGYRDSVFKHAAAGQIIVDVTFALPRAWQPSIEYAELARELAAQPDPTARAVFDAVVAIRRRKLPDPAVLGNAGSFFKNPIVSRAQSRELLAQHPALVTYDIGGGRCKLAAGWLIDACGLKGASEGAAAVYERQALVLVNRGGATGAQVLALARRVQEAVQRRFGVVLEPEPVIV